MEKMNMAPRAMPEKKGGSESKDKLFKNLTRKLGRLKLLGVVLVGMFASENLSAQNLSADSLTYNMNTKQATHIQKLTQEVDSKILILRNQLKNKVGVTELNESINGTKVSSTSTYKYKNISVGTGEGNTWVLDYKGDTTHEGEDSWVNITPDSTQPKMGAYYFEHGNIATELSAYTGDTETEFDYGDLSTDPHGEGNTLGVQHFTLDPNDKNSLMFRDANAEDGYKN